MGRVGFGQLWALNEELLAPGKAVPLHAHENMEIISIPLTGTLRYHDSRGVSHIIAPGDVHVLSAGLGITHREYNNSTGESAHYLQVWISPKSRMTPTAYAQTTIDTEVVRDRFFLIASATDQGGALPINQDAFLSMAQLAQGTALPYVKYDSGNGVYVFLIAGHLRAGSNELQQGDGLGFTDTTLPDFLAIENSRVLCIEVPLQNLQAKTI